MTAKAGALGAPALLADYRAFAGDPEGAAGLVGRALDLAGGGLAQELPAQLIGRLAREDAPGLAPCLAAAGRLIPAGALLPLRPTLTRPGAELRRFEGHEEWVRAVAVLADNRRALSAADDRTLRLWDLDSGAELRRFEGHGGGVRAVVVLADNRRALSGGDDRTLRLWDLDSGAELRRFAGHGGWVLAVAVLADNRRALSAGAGRTLRLWDFDSGAELPRFEGHKDRVLAVAVLADNRRALSAAADRTLRLWDLDSGRMLAALHFDVALSALAMTGRDRAVVGDALGRLDRIAFQPPGAG
jgi:WD40 repeat protein